VVHQSCQHQSCPELKHSLIEGLADGGQPVSGVPLGCWSAVTTRSCARSTRRGLERVTMYELLVSAVCQEGGVLRLTLERYLELIRERVHAFRATGDPELVLSDDALWDCRAIWETIEPVEGGLQSPAGRRRLATAHHARGLLHFLRAKPLPDADNRGDLALGYLMLAELAGDVERIPIPLRPLMRPTADPGEPGLGGRTCCVEPAAMTTRCCCWPVSTCSPRPWPRRRWTTRTGKACVQLDERSFHPISAHAAYRADRAKG
jgi:hypothetical protein